MIVTTLGMASDVLGLTSGLRRRLRAMYPKTPAPKNLIEELVREQEARRAKVRAQLKAVRARQERLKNSRQQQLAKRLDEAIRLYGSGKHLK